MVFHSRSHVTARIPHVISIIIHVNASIGINHLSSRSAGQFLVRHITTAIGTTTMRQRTVPPRLNFEVRHELMCKEALIGCFVCMSFAGSVV